MKNLIGDLFDNKFFYNEIEEISKKFNIPILAKFNQSDCEAFCLGFAGLEYCMQLGMDKIGEKVKINKFKIIINFIKYYIF